MSDDLDKPYFTMKNLPIRFENDCGEDRNVFFGYLLAISSITLGFKKIAKADDNLDDLTSDELKRKIIELKKQIMDHANEHTEFEREIRSMMDNQYISKEDYNHLPPALRPY